VFSSVGSFQATRQPHFARLTALQTVDCIANC
jgi:hypothetical protein